MILSTLVVFCLWRQTAVLSALTFLALVWWYDHSCLTPPVRKSKTKTCIWSYSLEPPTCTHLDSQVQYPEGVSVITELTDKICLNLCILIFNVCRLRFWRRIYPSGIFRYGCRKKRHLCLILSLIIIAIQWRMWSSSVHRAFYWKN